MSNDRLAHIQEFYVCLAQLEERIGGRRKLAECSGLLPWPNRGVYFFYEETVENKVLIGAISAWGIFKNSESTHIRDPARKRPDFHLKKGEKGRSDP